MVPQKKINTRGLRGGVKNPYLLNTFEGGSVTFAVILIAS